MKEKGPMVLLFGLNLVCPPFVHTHTLPVHCIIPKFPIVRVRWGCVRPVMFKIWTHIQHFDLCPSLWDGRAQPKRKGKSERRADAGRLHSLARFHIDCMREYVGWKRETWLSCCWYSFLTSFWPRLTGLLRQSSSSSSYKWISGKVDEGSDPPTDRPIDRSKTDKRLSSSIHRFV